MSDQITCQQQAVAAGAPFYSYVEPDPGGQVRHNSRTLYGYVPASISLTRPKCFYSTSCENPITDTEWPWKRYSDPAESPMRKPVQVGSPNCPSGFRPARQAECEAACTALKGKDYKVMFRPHSPGCFYSTTGKIHKNCRFNTNKKSGLRWRNGDNNYNERTAAVCIEDSSAT